MRAERRQEDVADQRRGQRSAAPVGEGDRVVAWRRHGAGKRHGGILAHPAGKEQGELPIRLIHRLRRLSQMESIDRRLDPLLTKYAKVRKERAVWPRPPGSVVDSPMGASDRGRGLSECDAKESLMKMPPLVSLLIHLPAFKR